MNKMPAHKPYTFAIHTGHRLAKNCKRVCLANALSDRLEEQSTGHNTRYKTLGFKWLCKRHLSHQGLLYLDSEVTPDSPTFHTAIRWQQV